MHHPSSILVLGCLLACAALPAADAADPVEAAVGHVVAFAPLDGNGDKRIDSAEWQHGRKALASALEKTRAEIADALAKTESGKVSRFTASESRPLFMSLLGQAKVLVLAKSDADGDGRLSDAEAADVVARCTEVLLASAARSDEQGVEIDWRTQTAVIIGKVIAGDRAMFPICDVNRDGQLTIEELDVCFKLLRAIAGD
jgi:hypothetical protein